MDKRSAERGALAPATDDGGISCSTVERSRVEVLAG
jgi:hypothetical protein